MTTSPSFDDCIQEVKELHQFFQDWFCGTLPNTDAAFARFADTIHPDFSIVGPDGNVTQQTALTGALRGAHSAGEFKIWVENAQAKAVGGGLTLVMYEEWQIRNGEQTVRQSSVLFRPKPNTPNGVEWLHVHETWKGGPEYTFDHS